MKTKFLTLLLLVVIFATMLCSCEVLKFVNHVLDFVPKPDSSNDTNIDLDINIGGTTAHVHTEGIIPAVESTCTEHGLTEGKYCTSCEKILVPQEEAPLKEHTYDNSVDKFCNVCEHERDIDCSHEGTIEFLPASESTCTVAGLTQGVKCTLCGETVVAQESLPLKDHVSSDWIIDKNATVNEEGLKHIECTVCGAVMLQSSIPVVKVPSEGLAYSLNSDQKGYTVTGIGSCEDTYIVIPEAYEGLPVTLVAEKAFYQNESITGVFIPKYIETIGLSAFSDCYSLAEVEFAHDSQLKTIEQSFAGCSSLKEIKIPSTVSKIWGYSFCQCTSLETVIFPKGVKELSDRTFGGCKSLKNVYYEGTMEDWLSITYSGYLYGDDGNPLCNGANLYIGNELVTDVVVPDTITTIQSRAFEGCISVKTITITTSVTNFNLSVSLSPNLKDIYYEGTIEDWCKVSHSGLSGANLYFNGELVTDVEIPSSVTELQPCLFSGCGSLQSVVIPNSITTVSESSFSGCAALMSVTIPDSVTAIDEYAFSGCTSLTDITLPNQISNIGNYAFNGCTSLTKITLPDSIAHIGDYAFKNCTALTTVVLPKVMPTIGIGAFDGCTSLQYNEYDNAYYLGTANNPYFILVKAKDTDITSCQIHDDTEIIDQKAFKDCSLLVSVSIGNSVRIISDYAFNKCVLLQSITVPNSVTSIGKGAFESCKALADITIPNSVTSIGGSAFRYCSSLTSVVLPDQLTVIESGLFLQCSALTNVKIPDSVTRINERAFYYCKALNNVTIPNSVTYVEREAFRGCTSLTAIVIPESVTRISDDMFYECSALESVILNSKVYCIGANAFSGCKALKIIVIPESVTTIERYAFYGCSKLTIYCEASSKPSSWNSNWNYSNRPVVWGYTGE